MRAPATLILAMVAAAVLSAASARYCEFVETRIGTGGAGFGIGSTNPGPQVPFGAMRLGPDTTYDWIYLPFNHFGGYYYNDSQITAFSHTHLVGAGVGDFGNVGVTAVRGPVSSAVVANYGYRSAFSHDTETAVPGYYSVLLEKPNVLAELTVSGTHTGMHRYTCVDAAAGGGCAVLVDVCHTVNRGKACKNATVAVAAPASTGAPLTVEGGVRVAGALSERSPLGGIDVFFSLLLEQPTGGALGAVALWENGTVLGSGVTTRASTSGSLGAFVGLNASSPGTGNLTALVRVGISFLSVADARANLMADQQPASDSALSFEAARAGTEAQWEGMLSRVQVAEATNPSAADHDDLVKFYSGLYRSFLAPTQYVETNQRYLGFDGVPHEWARSTGDGASFMSDMSIWDIHRSQAPLLALLAPERARDIGLSLIQMTEEGGHLPKWPLANIYTGCMVGSHAIIILSDFVAKGVPGINASEAFAVVKAAATAQDASKRYNELGYVPLEADERSAGLTLAFAFDDWAAAELATAVNATDDAAVFHNRSKRYANEWSSDRMLFCPKLANGTLQCPAFAQNPYPTEKHYVEASPWEYQFFVPGDPRGLVSLYPSRDVYVARLQETFVESQSWPFGTTLPNPWYWAGNEPDLFVPWQFPFAGNEYANYTQYWTRKLLEWKYNTTAAGVPGNDDYGTMSAWETFAYLGFYPQSGSGNGTYIIGSPRFTQATVALPSASVQGGAGPLLTITAHNASATAVYVARAEVNGQPLAAPFVRHADLTNGGKGGATLEFWMSESPSVWGEWLQR